MIGARVGDPGDEKQDCQNRAVIGARVGDRGETRPCHLASAARRPQRGRTRTRARALATEDYRWAQASRRNEA